ncbi:MAG: hypothetical protein Q8Q09_14865 [Deltaproteobacteria bacterium]|nr:hypothetical protein [Deltaproteobacteria bacterium]
MLRLLIRESLWLFLSLMLASILGFVVLDHTGSHDWWGTLKPGTDFGIQRDALLMQGAPRLYARSVRDATVLTLDDLERLRNDTQRDAARARLIARGTVVVPSILARLERLEGEHREQALRVLASSAAQLTGGDQPPQDTERAMLWWNNFRVLHEIDLRDAYARRHVQRLIESESVSARENLLRLGTLALPAVFEAFDQPLDGDRAKRLCVLVRALTAIGPVLTEESSAEAIRSAVAGWRAWWFVHHLEYVRLGESARIAARWTETRYGQWLSLVLTNRLGPSKITGQSVARELRRRLPESTSAAGLGGLIATALVVSFGGGPALRRRPLRAKLIDLVAALVPGMIAFSLGFLSVCALCTGGASPFPLAREVLQSWPTLCVSVLLVTALAVLWLRRRDAQLVLHAVRAEADSWAAESRDPHLVQIVRHGARVGVASLFAPAALNALVILALTLIVEPMTGVSGMGSLTIRALARNDGPWLLIAALSVVPVAFATRWARTALVWALGGQRALKRAAEAMVTAEVTAREVPSAVAQDESTS